MLALSASAMRIITGLHLLIRKMRLNMRTILSVAGIAALLASLAMVQQGRPHNADLKECDQEKHCADLYEI
jgi:hypothetical protein